MLENHLTFNFWVEEYIHTLFWIFQERYILIYINIINVCFLSCVELQSSTRSFLLFLKICSFIDISVSCVPLTTPCVLLSVTMVYWYISLVVSCVPLTNSCSLFSVTMVLGMQNFLYPSLESAISPVNFVLLIGKYG